MFKLKYYLKLWLIPLLVVIFVAGCEDRDGIIYPPDITVPTVTSTNPVNDAGEVVINQKITATFSEAMDSSTITSATFTLMQGSSFVSGTVSYIGTIATFSPSSFLSTTTKYTATITTMAKSNAGVALKQNYVWTFTTGEAASVIPPAVSLTDPLNAATGVPINQKIAATFTDDMDATTFTEATFTLKQGSLAVPGFVSYSGRTAIFAPSSNLAPNTAYTATITTGVKNLTNNSLENNYVWNFTTGPTAVVTPPIVSLTDPANAETGVALNQKIAATFSKTMDATTITPSTFTLRSGATSVSGFVFYSGTTAIFSPASNLAPNTVYTATITTGAKDLTGNAIESNYVWSFTTGTTIVVTPPVVSLTDPTNAETGVILNQKVSASFSKTMDATTITTSTFTLKQGTTAVSGFVSYSGTTAIFAPASNLVSNTVYTATITTGAVDLSGTALENNYTWSFTTGATIVITPPIVSFTDPLDGETGIALNQKVAASFNKTMDATTITASTFTLKQGTTPVSGYVSYSGTTAIFAPTSNLAPNALYTATITTGVKDLSGIALENNYTWSFVTGSAPVVIPPIVISTDPLSFAVNVAMNNSVTASFSKTMDATTISAATFTLKQGTTSVSGHVSYSGTTAKFAPASNLAPNTVYTATITTGAKDLSGNALENNYIWSFTTGAAPVVIAPIVISTDPLNNATNISLNYNITAAFSKIMDASTITASTFTLKQGTTPVTGFVSYSGTTAKFAPASNLAPNTVYTATITTGAKDLTGTPIANNYVWTFTTGLAPVVTPPTVTSTDPLNGATNVALNYSMTASFSKTMDATTITASTFTLKQGTTSISGHVSYSGTTAKFEPAGNLAPNTVYTATITTGAKDLSGNALENNYIWSFTSGSAPVVIPPTVTLTNPLNGAINVALNSSVAATFSKTMDATTITAATFTLKQGTTSVSGHVSYSGVTAVFVPASNLAPNTVFTATITTGAKDLSGNSLVSNYVWEFTTGSTPIVTPPTVTNTNPLNGAIDVALNTHVTATFSKTMNASTITTATFTLMHGSLFVAGTVSYSGNIATFIPSINLLPNTTYTATITTDARDLTGNSLVENFVWSFTTGTVPIITYTVSLSSNPSGGGSTNGEGTYNSGATVVVMANPTVGYTFTNWTENGIIISTNSSYEFVITSNRTFVANFSEVPVLYTVSLSSNPPGGGSTSGGGQYNSGAIVTVTATPNAGYSFTNWIENGVIVSTNTSYQFVISGNRTLVANFILTPVQFTVSLFSNPSEGGSTSGGGQYNSGATVTVVATPNAGYSFTNWTESGVIVSTNASYQFVITGNRTLTARFDIAGPLIDLGAASTYGGFGGSAGLTNQGIFTVVNGNIGTTAASTLVTGFRDGQGDVYTITPLNDGLVTGVVNCAPPAPGTAVKFELAQQALADATNAYNFLAGLPGGSDQGAGELGNLVLAPGTYTAAGGTFKITEGDLTLDAQGNPNAVWVFQMAQSLTVGLAGQARSIILVNGAKANNVYWQVGSAATINAAGGGTMAGTIIAYSGVTFSTAGNVELTTLNGRALSLNASVTMVNSIINVPAP